MSLNPLGKIPSVSELLENPALRSLVERINHSTLVSTARTVLDELRHEVHTVASERTLPDVTELAERIASRIMETTPPRMRSVVNATGVLFHAELGRPPLADVAAEAMTAVARGFVDEPRRGGENHVCREALVEKFLRELTSAERGLALSSIGVATAATLAALCGEGNVEHDENGQLCIAGQLVVSRGHLVDFGDYRIAELASSVGVWIEEVGATNSTTIEDYTRAINNQTAAVLWVDDGRFAMQGYARSVGLKEVVAAAHHHKVPAIAHLNGGTLLDGGSIGIANAASVSAAVAAGADLVIFRGDRLLGGPQCGLIAGRRSLIEQIERHALAAAGRLDGSTSAALAETLRLHADPQRARQAIPLLQLLSASADNLKNRCERLVPQLLACDVVESVKVNQTTASLCGSGLPADELASWQIEIVPAGKDDEKHAGVPVAVERLADALLKGEPAVAAKIVGGRLLLDMRSVIPWQDIELVAAFEAMNEEEDN